MRPDGRRHTIKDLYHEDTYFDFLSRRWRWALVSGVLLLISLGGFLLRGGLNLGLDFTGGTAWQLTISPSKDLSTADIRGIVSSAGISDPKIVILGSRGVRVEASEVAGAGEQRVTNALAEGAGISARAVSVSEVGPSWGDQVSREALLALIFFFVAVALYLSVRFEFKMAMAALAAVVHDILITVGVYAVTGIEVTPATVIAFLTILGFSLYDTVVVFDKIGENTPQLTTVKGMTYTSMANRSLNQVLMRSLNTSFVALLPVTSLLVVGVGLEGALALREFGLALFIGLLIGTYSSIFVATPLLVAWKEREPRYQALQERAAARESRGDTPAPTASVGATETGTSAAPRPGSETDPVITPRPRQQRSRKRR